MNKFVALLFIALLTFVVVLLITNPDLFNDIYLYLIGLAGVIVKVLKGFADSIKKAIKGEEDDQQATAETKQSPQKPAQKTTISTNTQTAFYQSDAVG